MSKSTATLARLFKLLHRFWHAVCAFHPPIEELVIAVGIGLIVFLRPWFDGITYPEYNIPFTWACGALAVFWGAMVLAGRMQVRFLFPVSLLAVFLLVAVGTAPFSVQYDATYRSLINWSGNLLLFCAAANGLRSRISIAIVIGMFAVTSIAEAIWAVLQVMYIMPINRAALMRDPSLISIYFGEAGRNAAMSARLESNRAYGSLLFANALACWLLTGIPIAIASTNGLYLRLKQSLAEMKISGKRISQSPFETSRVLYATIAVGILVFLGITIYYMTFFTLAHWPGGDIGQFWIRWIFYCAVIPIALTAAAGYWAARNGAGNMVRVVCMVVSALFGVTAVYGLGASYSRGGMLASGASLLVLVGLMYHHHRLVLSQNARRAATILIVGISLLPIAQLGLAQQPARADGKNAQQAPITTQLALEGHNPSLQAMLDPNTALLRFGYWISGLHMFAAHPLTGVGLGNFATAYPHYQLLGAGDVKPAHNDYLQAACETGVFGLIAFLGFWIYFALVNAKSILKEQDRASRWFRAGVFAGVMGFLAHSFVDFNFFNASLAALVFAMAGVSFAFVPQDYSVTRSRGRMVAIAVFALVAWTVFAGARVSGGDNAIGRDTTRRVRLATTDMLIDTKTPSRDFSQPLAMFENTLALLIDDPAVRDTMGDVIIPTGPKAARHAKPGEVLPADARRYLTPESMPAITKATLDAIRLWIDRCVKADARYPHNPELSAHIVQWWEKLQRYSPDMQERIRAADEEIKWSEICIQRSPLQTAYYDALAKALWDRGELETTAKQLEYYDRAIENWRTRAELYPVKPVVWREYAANCIAYGDVLKKAGDAARGQKLVDQGNAANKHADDLDAQIQKIALGKG